jgi:putative redox protein
MSSLTVLARWAGEELNFIGVDAKGYEIKLGAGGYKPSQLMLLGLAGCTAMDVLSILQKKRLAISDMQVHVTGHQPDDYPKPFQVIDINYVVKGKNIDPQAVERAIALSQDKYCIVSQTLQHPVEIKATFTIEETVS